MKRNCRSERGAANTEYALLLLLAVWCAIGIFGTGFNAQTTFVSIGSAFNGEIALALNSGGAPGKDNPQNVGGGTTSNSGIP